MTIREIAKEFKDEIMEGIAWVAIWKTGLQKRSWNALAFYLDDEDKIKADDIGFAQEIVKMDEKAILINVYYCAHMGDGTLQDIINGIRFHYENEYNQLKTSMAYEEALAAAEKELAETGGEVQIEKTKIEKVQQIAAFMKTEAGEEIKKTIREWDQVIEDGHKAAAFETLIEQDRKSDICGAKWEAFKLMLKQLYGIELFFTRTDEYFGICTEDEEIFLMKEYRKQEGGKDNAEI